MGYKNRLYFLRDTAKDLNPEPEFIHASDYEFASINGGAKYTIWVRPLISSYLKAGISITQQVAVEIFFLKQTAMDMDTDQTVKALDETQQLADEFVRLIHPWNWKHKEANDELYKSSCEVDLITAQLSPPPINDFPDVLSGQLLSLTLHFKDDFDYCLEC